MSDMIDAWIEDQLTLAMVSTQVPIGLQLYFAGDCVIPWSCAHHWRDLPRAVEAVNACILRSTIPGTRDNIPLVAMLVPVLRQSFVYTTHECPVCGKPVMEHCAPEDMVWWERIEYVTDYGRGYEVKLRAIELDREARRFRD